MWFIKNLDLEQYDLENLDLEKSRKIIKLGKFFIAWQCRINSKYLPQSSPKRKRNANPFFLRKHASYSALFR